MKILLLLSFILVSCKEKSESNSKAISEVAGNSVYEIKYEGKIYLVYSNGGIVEHKPN